MKNRKTILRSMLFIGVTSILFVGCNQAESGSSTKDGVVEEVILEEDVIIEEDVWVIDEHKINDVPLTNHPDATKAAEVKEVNEAAAATAAEIEYEIATTEAMELALAEAEYEAKHTIEVTEIAIPLDETQTVVSYGKKGEPQAVFQVVSDIETGEIEQIMFIDKKHQDVYNVQTGMTGKEVKKLRKELKHMVKKGQVFLYDDQSNVMYLMDAKNMAGDEIVVEDIETMEVQAVIWKDKKHHKNN